MRSTFVVVILMCCAANAHAAPTFTVVTTESGVQALRDGKPADWWMSGLSFVDLDHDGDLDLYLSDHHDAALAAINDGKGNFVAAGGAYPTSEIHNFLDVDEDGKVDMDMTYADGGAKWWLNKTAVGSSMLQLTDVGDVDTRDGNESRSESLVDLNRDGKIDWVRGCQGSNFKIDFGDGKGNFAKDSALVAQPQGDAQDAGMIFADLDADGDLDMVINWGGYSSPGGDDYGRVRVLINDGQMNFVERTTDIGLKTDHLAILGAGDIDQDGDVDLIGLDDRTFPEVIYVNDGHGSFSVLPNAVTGVTGAAEYALWGLATVTDLDNDGVADILIDGRYFFHVLHGTGGGHFAYQNDAWGGITHTAEASVDGGFAFGDIDGDGDLDLMGFTAGDPNRQVALYRNDLPAQNWLNVRPVGVPGNKAGVNSKIRIYEANTDHLLWVEEVLAFSKQAQQNYYAFDALERHYGLGTKDTVDVTVTFYPSGTVVRKNGVAKNSTLLIAEDGTNGIVEPPTPSTSGGGGSAGAGAAQGGSPSGGSSSGGAPSGGLPSGGLPSGDSGSGSSPKSDSGCSCRLSASRAPRNPAVGGSALALLALLALRRRRARPRNRAAVAATFVVWLAGCSSTHADTPTPAAASGGQGGDSTTHLPAAGMPGAGAPSAGATSGGASSGGGSSGGSSGMPVVTAPGTKPPSGPSSYAGVKPEAGTPASIGNTRIFDDLAGLIWNQTKQELLFVVGQNNQIMRYRVGLPDAQNFDVVRPGGENMDEMKGLDLGPDGALWVCEARDTAPHRVSRSAGGYDHPVTVVDHWQGSAAVPASDFTSPWYISVRWDGNVYFTDTPHRYSGIADKSVFRIDPAGNLTMLKHYASDADLSEGGAFGIALSPSHNAFYISTWNHPGYPQLVRFDLDDSGGVAKETLLLTDMDGPIQSVDGLCVDQGENLYLCTGEGGVRMYSPAGAFLGSIDVPGATDCTFGGADMKTLFVGTSGSVAGDKNLYQVPMNIPGLP